MSEQPHFAVLGPLEVTRAGQPVRLGSTRLRTLLATLLLRANQPVSITDLADRLWNDQPPGQARRTIQVYVVRLRQALGDADLISTDSTGYLIRVDAHHLDLSSFDNLVRDAARTTDVAKRAELLTKALALWRGPACADVVSDVLQAHEVPPFMNAAWTPKNNSSTPSWPLAGTPSISPGSANWSPSSHCGNGSPDN